MDVSQLQCMLDKAMAYGYKNAGFILTVFGTGVAVGKLVEKIERLDRRREDEENKRTSKNDRR